MPGRPLEHIPLLWYLQKDKKDTFIYKLYAQKTIRTKGYTHKRLYAQKAIRTRSTKSYLLYLVEY